MRMETLQKEEQTRAQEVHELNKETLLAAKARLDNEIKRFEKKELNDHTRNIAHHLHEISAAVATTQDMLNLIWKRTEQMHEELAALRGKTE